MELHILQSELIELRKKTFDIFPFVNVPFINSTSISDIFSGCLTCQPFGKLKRRSVDDCSKPSREIKTISSLVEKFTVVYEGKNGQNNTTPDYSRCSAGNPYYPCSRSTSFNLDMNHEKFTPCERQRFNPTDYHQSPTDSFHGGHYGKINYICRASPNLPITCEEKIPEKPIVVPPRRKKRPAPRIALDPGGKDNSMESNRKRENWKNYRNLQLNNLDQPDDVSAKLRNDVSRNASSNCRNFKVSSNSSECTNISYVTNNKLLKNNKSGCSKLAVVSDSLESNAMQNFSKFDRVSDNSNSNNIISDNFEAGYCENKIYYKNSGFDEFGNYEHGNDADEVLVCESYVKYDPEPKRQSPEANMAATTDHPKNSTYTKFYTDKFYQDNFEMMSTKSMDEPFERIVQLQPEMAPFLQSALAMLKAKEKPTSKQQERQSNQLQKGHPLPRGSSEEDDIADEDNSIPVVFCGLLPIHQLNSAKWMQSVRIFEQTVPKETLPAEDDDDKGAISNIVDSHASRAAKHDNNPILANGGRNANVRVVGCYRKKVPSTGITTRRTESCLTDDDLTLSHGDKTHGAECRQYAGVDHCEL